MKRIWKGVAPFWDRYDSSFALILLVFVLLGYVAFVETISLFGLTDAFRRFVKSSGLIAILTSWTAIVGLYRLRHKPDKTRPTVREDFEGLDDSDNPEFGIRNFGPGPALYVQAVATIDEGGTEKDLNELRVHDAPIHLQEGDFECLLPLQGEDWVPEGYETFLQDGDTGNGKENSTEINIYLTYLSQSGAREPTNISAEREDTDLLKKLKTSDSDPRSIKLSRVVEELGTLDDGTDRHDKNEAAS